MESPVKLVVIVVHFEQASKPCMYIHVPREWRAHLAVFRRGLSVRHWWWRIYPPGPLAPQILPRNRDLPAVY